MYLYHGTTAVRATKIRKKGLAPGVSIGNTSASSVYLSSSLQYAKSYALRKGGPNGVVLRTQRTADMIPDKDMVFAGDYKTRRTVPASRIEVLQEGLWTPLSRWRASWE